MVVLAGGGGSAPKSKPRRNFGTADRATERAISGRGNTLNYARDASGNVQSIETGRTTTPNFAKYGDLLNQPQPTNPWAPPGGGGGGRGGGGGGGGAGGLSQQQLDQMLGFLGKTKPGAATYRKFDGPTYNPLDFYGFDTSQYDQARTGLGTAMRDDLAAGNTAYDAAGVELDQYRNPFAGGLQTTNPGVTDSMRRMMRAQGVNPGAANRTASEGVQADRAMGNQLAMLAAVDQRRQGSNQRALEGDRRRFTEGMGAEGRSLGLGIDMAQAGARSGYDRDRFGYNAANQRQLYDDDLQRQMLDYSRRNQVDDSNLMSQNAWMAGLTSPLMQLLSGQNGLDLSGIGGLI